METRKLIPVSLIIVAAALSAGSVFAEEQPAAESASGTPPATAVQAPQNGKLARKQLRETIKQDRLKLKKDVAQFGKESDQVKADRVQLKKDVQALKGMHRKHCEKS